MFEQAVIATVKIVFASSIKLFKHDQIDIRTEVHAFVCSMADVYICSTGFVMTSAINRVSKHFSKTLFAPKPLALMPGTEPLLDTLLTPLTLC